MDSLKKTARLAGLLYLVSGIAAGFAVSFTSSQIIVRGNAAATFENLLAKEFAFRLSVVSDLLSAVLFLFLALVLYRLFREVNEFAAQAMVALVIVQVPVAFVLESFNMTALMIAKGELFAAFDSVKAQEWTIILLRISRTALIVLQIFWGLWLIPFGQLVYKSRFIPRIFGALLIFGGTAYVADSLTALLFPFIRPFVTPYLMVCFAAGELPIIFWLLIKGIKVQKI